MNDSELADFVNKEQLTFAKWIVSLSIAIISFTFAFLLENFSSFEYRWIFIIGLILLAISIIAGVRYVGILLAAFGYGIAFRHCKALPESEKSIRRRDKYKKLEDKYTYRMCKPYYEIVQTAFLLGLIFIIIFVISNFMLQALTIRQ